MSHNLNIAVLMGGPSAEREVSLKSGAAVAKALESCGHRVTRVDPQDGVLQLPPGMDVVFLALHGTYGEDGSVQQELEAIGMPYTGSRPTASRLAFDKLASKRVFWEQGLATPRFCSVSQSDATIPSDLGMPLVVKPVRQGSSVGLSFIRETGQWVSALEEVLKFGGEALVEEFITGRELTVGILGEEAYEHKYTVGATRYFCPADLDEEVTRQCQLLALNAFKALGCEGYGRVDIMLDGDQAYLLEVNTLPGMTETSLLPMSAGARDMGFAELCEWMIQDALDRHAKNNKGNPA
jgi:D-alanine-D-alanine ligase